MEESNLGTIQRRQQLEAEICAISSTMSGIVASLHCCVTWVSWHTITITTSCHIRFHAQLSWHCWITDHSACIANILQDDPITIYVPSIRVIKQTATEHNLAPLLLANPAAILLHSPMQAIHHIWKQHFNVFAEHSVSTALSISVNTTTCSIIQEDFLRFCTAEYHNAGRNNI